MNLDSIKIKVHLSELDFPKSQYKKQILEDGVSKHIKYVLEGPCLGLSRIEILPETSSAVVQCSSKILKEDYLSGINENTVGRLHSSLVSYFSIKEDELLRAHLLRADITENLYFDNRAEKELAVRSLCYGKSNIAFKVDDYTQRGDGIVFTGHQKSYKNRQIYYNKEKELRLAKNKDMWQYLDGRWDDISRILRVEQNVVSYKRLWEALGDRPVRSVEYVPWHQRTPKPVILEQMLDSSNPSRPLLKRHNKIMEYANSLELFDDYNVGDAKLMLEHKGLEGIWKDCNCSTDLAVDIVKAKWPRVWSTHHNKYLIASDFYDWKKKFLTHISNIIVRSTQDSWVDNEDSYFSSLMKIGKLLRAS